MKIILSRKGFDASYGGRPSPILPDGRLVPLPIPSSHDHHTFSEANLGPADQVDKLLSDLSKGEFHASSTVHLDPDLRRNEASRPQGWRPAFGQTGIAQSHLASRGVGNGDLFLFFGWFREVTSQHGRWTYAAKSPDLHLIFGWLEVDERLPVVTHREECLVRHPWIADHPHVAQPGHYMDQRNTLYISKAKSDYYQSASFGGGRFARYSQRRKLTKTGHSRSIWSLPPWFMPTEGRKPLTYHADPKRWTTGRSEEVILKTVGKGQEFVLDCDDYPEAVEWASSIIDENVKS